jgi:hypothetical protein
VLHHLQIDRDEIRSDDAGRSNGQAFARTAEPLGGPPSCDETFRQIGIALAALLAAGVLASTLTGK